MTGSVGAESTATIPGLADQARSILVVLRGLREMAGLTQADIAGRMGVTQQRVGVIENGEDPPTLDVLDRYAKAVGYRLRIVVGIEGP